MAETRVRFDLRLEKSLTPGSTLISNNENEAQWLNPGTNGQLLTIVSGVPIWQTLNFPSEYDQYANVASLPITGNTDVIYYTAAENQFRIWNGSNYILVPTSPTFTVSGNTGTNQSIVSGDTLSIVGASNSGVIVTASNTDTLTISIREQVDNFNPTTGTSVVTASQTPLINYLKVYRNGILQDITDDYTVSGNTITFLTSFGSSTGAVYSEKVKLVYKY